MCCHSFKNFLYIKLLGYWEIYHHQITFSDLRECEMDTAVKPGWL